jgi:hypothetical protein
MLLLLLLLLLVVVTVVEEERVDGVYTSMLLLQVLHQSRIRRQCLQRRSSGPPSAGKCKSQ